MTPEPSAWIVRFAPLIPAGGRILDLACGSGRNSRFLTARGMRPTYLDRDVSGVADLVETAEIIEADLEGDRPWPLADRTFDAVLVVNYLYRPLLPTIIDAVAEGGVLLYETFAVGNEQYGRPRSPDFLLRPGELLEATAGRIQVVAYEAGMVEHDSGPRVVQRLCAVRSVSPAPLPH